MPSSVRLAFHYWRQPQTLNQPNRRVRTRTHGGVGGGSCKASPYPDRFFEQHLRNHIISIRTKGRGGWLYDLALSAYIAAREALILPGG
jgi:hypothetical protein